MSSKSSAPDPNFAVQSTVTDPGTMGDWLDQAIPSKSHESTTMETFDALRRVARSLAVHYRDSRLTDLGVPPERMQEIGTRYADLMFARIIELDPRPLATERDLDHRLIGCCRDFTVLFVSLLRRAGIPARSRVGFASYFAPDWWIDHVVAEVWDASEGRWRLVDAQIDDTHTDANDASFEAHDVPRDRFLTGPVAWASCRTGERDADRFAVAPDIEVPILRGWSYLRHNLVQDLAALNRHEQLLWDTWGLTGPNPSTPEEMTLLDHVASITGPIDPDPTAVAALFSDPRLGVPAVVNSIDPLSGEMSRVTMRMQNSRQT